MTDGHGGPGERRLHGQLLLLMFPVLNGVDRFDQVILADADAEVLDVFTAFTQNKSEFFPLRSIRQTLPYLESLGVKGRQISADSPPCSQESVIPPSLPCSPAAKSPTPVWVERMREVGYSEQEIELAAELASPVTEAVSPSHLQTDCPSPPPHSPTAGSPHSSTAFSPHSSSLNPAGSPSSGRRGTKRHHDPEVMCTALHCTAMHCLY